MCQQATLELPHTGRSSTATGYVQTNHLGLPCTGRSSWQQAMCQQTTLSCLTRVAQAQQQAMCKPGYLGLPHTDAQAQQAGYVHQQATRLPHTVAQHNDRAMYNSTTLVPALLSAQQQTMCQPGYWSCLTRVAQPATGYVPAGLLGRLTPGRLQHQRSCVPARYPAGAMPTKLRPGSHRPCISMLALSCLTRSAQAQQGLCTSRLP
jgi:hypothetical protein